MAIIKKFRIKSFKNTDPLLEVKNISISFEQRIILDNIDSMDTINTIDNIDNIDAIDAIDNIDIRNSIKLIVILIDDDEVSDVYKELLYINNNKNNEIKNKIELLLKKHKDYSILYFLNFKINSSIESLEELSYIDEIEDIENIKNIENNNLFDLISLKKLDFDMNDSVMNNENSLITILKKKEKNFYIKKRKEKKNKSRKKFK